MHGYILLHYLWLWTSSNNTFLHHEKALVVDLFSSRRWTTGSAQQSNNYGIMTCMCCMNFRGVNINTTAFCLDRSSPHLLLLKSSIERLMFQLQKVKVYQLTNQTTFEPNCQNLLQLPVWPDLAIFLSYGQQIIYKKYPNCKVTFWA